MIRFSYEPVKVKETAFLIRKEHKHKEKTLKTGLSPEIKNFIMEVCDLKYEDIHTYSELLSPKRILILAEYITMNTFHVNLKNIVKILKYRMNNEVFRTIYKSWQNTYREHNVPDCTHLIISVLKKSPPEISYINEHGLRTCLKKWLMSDEKEYEVCTELINYCRTHNNCYYRQAAEYYDISGSVIDIEASKLYYCCCDKTDYLKIADDDLYNMVKNYNLKFQKMFLINFIRCLDVNQMSRYKCIWSTAYKNINIPGGKGFQLFFTDDIPNIDDLKRKYTQWYNVNQVDAIFGDDERAQFWKAKVFDYDVVEYKYNKSSNSLTMKFGNYVVVEFKEEGPMYFFSIDYYNNNVRRYCESYRSNLDLRQTLLHSHTDKESFHNRISHVGNWKSKTNSLLCKLLG